MGLRSSYLCDVLEFSPRRAHFRLARGPSGRGPQSAEGTRAGAAAVLLDRVLGYDGRDPGGPPALRRGARSVSLRACTARGAVRAAPRDGGLLHCAACRGDGCASALYRGAACQEGDWAARRPLCRGAMPWRPRLRIF
jgi:hypothetical protein